MTQANTSTFGEHAEIVLRDEEGNPFLVIGAEKITVIGAQGEVSEYTRESVIRLEDGLMWSPSMLKWASPVALTTCAVCRGPKVSLFRRVSPRHGLVSVRNARPCAYCGRVLCPQHRRWVGDGWRCKPCSRTYILKEAIRPLFFREER